MSLQRWVGDSLQRFAATPAGLRKLLDAAARHIADARVRAVSAETRFSSAYTAIRLLADLGLQAHGYRTLSSRVGHHQVAIQSLGDTFGVDAQTIHRLDSLRRQRNRTEYTGDVVTEPQVAGCLREAEALLALAERWLRAHRPDALR